MRGGQVNVDSSRYDVVISGASFAGLALARALSVSLGPELRIAVIDRGKIDFVSPGADSRASALSAGSQRVLDVLGLWTLVADEAEPVRRIEISDSSLDAGVRPVLLTYENEVAPGQPASWIVPNATLMRAFGETVADAPGVTFLSGAEAVGLETHASELRLSLADGRSLAAALVVAADGRRSPLREAAGIKIVGWSYPQTGIVTTVAHERPHGGVAVQHFLPAGPFAILPLRGNRSCITWTEDRDEARRILAIGDEAFLDEVDLRFGGRLGALSLAGSRGSWPLEMHLARSYVAPRVALVGDAAHTVHPIAGQGLNLALRDVAALAEVVAEAARLGLDIGTTDVLRRYERWRRFDSLLSAAAFDGLNRLFSNDWTLLRAVRDVGLGIVDRLPALKRIFIGEAAGLSGELPRLIRGERI
jgi:2-octaprenyl-6-methoxyphenol hydroxylase